MIWVQFLASATLLVVAAYFLARYGDAIALRTGLGGMFIGTILLSAATSLPELLTGINAIQQDVPDITVGNIFGSIMFNMFILAVLDMLFRRTRILRSVAEFHALTAGLGTLLTGLAVFFILAEIDFRLGWLGIDSLLLMGMYVLGTLFIRGSSRREPVPPVLTPAELRNVPSLGRSLVGFAITAGVLVAVTPLLVSSAAGIATITGLGTGFVGLVLVALVTSLPEVVTTIAAVRMKAYDMAIGNLFGSNIFNIFALAVTDLFYVQGSFLVDIDNPSLALAGLLGLVLTGMALVGNLARVERRLWLVEIDALLILVTYGLGIVFLYSRGITL